MVEMRGLKFTSYRVGSCLQPRKKLSVSQSCVDTITRRFDVEPPPYVFNHVVLEIHFLFSGELGNGLSQEAPVLND